MTRNPPSIDIANKALGEVSDSYESLLGASAWARLSPEVRQRFSADRKCQSTRYQGVMDEVFLSSSGKLLAHLCRLIGTPWALYNGRGVPITVDVYHDKKTGGMTWDRFFFFKNKKVNRVRSTKIIQKDSRLVEVVGGSFGMYLDVTEKAGGIYFESARFFCQCGKVKIPIPHILTPGKTKVSQTALDGGEFEFKLSVTHRLLGCVFRQVGRFKEFEF